MATSDSDDFESADEDVEDSKTLSVDKSTLNQGNASIGRSDVSSSSCSSTLTSSGGDVALTTDTEVDRLEAAKNDVTANENKLLTAGVDGLEITDDAKGEPLETRDKRETKPKQQKTRHPKSGGAKKLGTKIISTCVQSETVTVSSSDGRAEGNGEKRVVAASRDSTDSLPSPDAIPDREPSVPCQESSKGPDKGATENKATVLDTPPVFSSGKGWSGWGGWGVSSLLSSATEGVASLTSQVSQGLSTVLEAGIGAPDPEELARLQREEAAARLQHDQAEHRQQEGDASASGPEESGASIFGLGQLMSGVSSITRLVESTGTRVITGGLDTLETIGKKTMEVLQEGDPGLKKKRALFSDQTVLSQVLREAKQRAEMEDLHQDELRQARKAHFETLFDDYQGLVHLEALEMLSKQCELKLQASLLAASGPSLAALQCSHHQLRELCQLPEEDENAEWQDMLATAADHLGVPFVTTKMFKTWSETAAWLGEGGQYSSAREVHRRAMESLALLTAESVEQFHKVAELLLVKEHRNPRREAQLFVQITSAVTSALNLTATQFAEHLNKCPVNSSSPDEVNNLITNVFLEANNSSSYVEEALRLLVPVLQVALE